MNTVDTAKTVDAIPGDELLSSAAVNRRPESQLLMNDILREATRLFSARGFVGTTTQEVADSVGLVKGTLYYHIGSKEELLFRIHQQVTNEGAMRWQALLTSMEQESRSDLLRALIVEHCRIIHEYRDWVAVLSEEIKFLPPKYATLVRQTRADYQELMEQVLRQGVENGEFIEHDPHMSARIILGKLNAMYRWYSPDGELSPAEIGVAIADMTLDGIAA